MRAFALVFEHPAGHRIDADFVCDTAAPHVERIPQSAAAAFALQFAVGDFSGTRLERNRRGAPHIDLHRSFELLPAIGDGTRRTCGGDHESGTRQTEDFHGNSFDPSIITSGSGRSAHPYGGSAAATGCVPGRCGMSRISATMTAAITADASGRQSASPPCTTALSKKSPTVAPSGRVRRSAA